MSPLQDLIGSAVVDDGGSEVDDPAVVVLVVVPVEDGAEDVARVAQMPFDFHWLRYSPRLAFVSSSSARDTEGIVAN